MTKKNKKEGMFFNQYSEIASAFDGQVSVAVLRDPWSLRKLVEACYDEAGSFVALQTSGRKKLLKQYKMGSEGMGIVIRVRNSALLIEQEGIQYDPESHLLQLEVINNPFPRCTVHFMNVQRTDAPVQVDFVSRVDKSIAPPRPTDDPVLAEFVNKIMGWGPNPFN